jgi:hypothetical protein
LLSEYAFPGATVSTRHRGRSVDQHTEDGLGKAPQVEGWFVIIFIDLDLLTRMENISVFHTGWFLWKNSEEN